MPKGEFDTPGPFTADDMRHFVLQNGRGVLVFAAWLDEAEQEELVGLLNKGTHFNALVDALKAVCAWQENPSDVCDDQAENARDLVYTALAAATGENP